MPKRGTITAVIVLLVLAAFSIASCVGALPTMGKGHGSQPTP
jgi:predicted small secreted protein